MFYRRSIQLLVGRLILLLIILSCTLSVQAQRFNFRQYQPDVGLNSPELTYLDQDSRGNLWIGTRGQGLYKFDGRDFQNLNREDSLVGEFILALLIDDSEKIWASTLNGLSIYKGSGFVESPIENGQLFDMQIRALYEDNNGQIWFSLDSAGIGSYKQGIIKYNKKVGGITGVLVTEISGNDNGDLFFGTSDGRLITLTDTVVNVVEIPEAGKVNCVFENENGIWVGSEGGLNLIKNGKANNMANRYTAFYKNNVFDIEADKAGNLWFGTARGAYELKDNIVLPYGEKEGLVDTEVYSILRDKDENMWFSAGKEGLFSFMGDRFTYLTMEDGLTYKYISGIQKDDQGSYWIASFGGGVMRYVNKSVLSMQLHPALDAALITVTFKDSRGALWFATRNSGVFRYFPSAKQATKISSTLNVNSIIENRFGQILIGHELGITYFSLKRKKVMADRSLDYPVRALFEDEVSNLWVGTDKGLKFPDMDSPLFDSSEMQVTSINQDMYGAIWVSSLGKGLFRFEGDHVTVYTKKQGLSSNLYYYIQFDKNGLGWASGTKGLDRLAVDEMGFLNEVKSYNLDNGYVGVGRYGSGFLSENNGNIWLGTNEQIMIYNSLADDVSNVKPEISLTGIQLFREDVDWSLFVDTVDSWTNTPLNLVLDYDQNYLTFNFAGVDLRSAYDIRYSYKLDPLEPNWSRPTENNSADYSNLTPGDYEFKARAFSKGNKELYHEISYTFTIRKPFWQKPLFYVICIFLFVLITYLFIKWYTSKVSRENRILEEKITARTAEISTQKEALQEQKEELETINDKLSSAHGTINEQNLRLKTYNVDLEDQVKERTKKLAKTNKELISINKELDTFIYKASHDLLGPLARLKGICNVAGLEVKEEVAKKYFEMLNESAEQTYDILQTLIKIISIKEVQVNKVNVDFEKLVEEVLTEIKSVSGYNEVEITYDIEGIDSLVMDKELIKIILYNIFQNSIEYRDFTKKNPYVKMQASNGDGILRIEIADNGVGIEKGVSDRIFDMFYRGTVLSKGSGLGLYIAQVIAKKLEGSIRHSVNEKKETVFSVHLAQ